MNILYVPLNQFDDNPNISIGSIITNYDAMMDYVSHQWLRGYTTVNDTAMDGRQFSEILSDLEESIKIGNKERACYNAVMMFLSYYSMQELLWRRLINISLMYCDINTLLAACISYIHIKGIAEQLLSVDITFINSKELSGNIINQSTIASVIAIVIQIVSTYNQNSQQLNYLNACNTKIHTYTDGLILPDIIQMQAINFKDLGIGLQSLVQLLRYNQRTPGTISNNASSIEYARLLAVYYVRAMWYLSDNDVGEYIHKRSLDNTADINVSVPCMLICDALNDPALYGAYEIMLKCYDIIDNKELINFRMLILSMLSNVNVVRMVQYNTVPV